VINRFDSQLRHATHLELTQSRQRPIGEQSTVIGAGQILCVAFWTGVRDAGCTLVASGGGFLATLLARTTCAAMQPLHILYSGLNVFALGATSFVFAGGVDSQGRVQRPWTGAVVAVGCTGLMLYAIYRDLQDPDSWEKKACGMFGTLVYSLLRELLQNQGRRFCPELGVQSHRKLRWECSRHAARLIMGSMIYGGFSALLNGWLQRSIVSSNFGAMDQALEPFTLDSWRTYGLRSLNEGVEGFICVLLLGAVFCKDLESRQGACSNRHDDTRTALVRGSSRAATNGFINSISTAIPSTSVALALLQGLSSFRSAILGAKPTPPASERGERPPGQATDLEMGDPGLPEGSDTDNPNPESGP
jgi:hypothetical protein